MSASIDNLTNNHNQATDIVLDDGSTVTFNLRFKETMSPAFWILDVIYGDFEIHNLRLCAHANLLRQWKNVLPFGLAVISNDGLDPMDINDFINGRITLYVLDTTDIQTAETFIQGQA